MPHFVQYSWTAPEVYRIQSLQIEGPSGHSTMMFGSARMPFEVSPGPTRGEEALHRPLLVGGSRVPVESCVPPDGGAGSR